MNRYKFRSPCSEETKVKIRNRLIEYYQSHFGQNKGKRFSLIHRKRISLAHANIKHWNWKGNTVKYQGVHSYINRNYPKPKKCEMCHQVKPLDISNISGLYKRDILDWEWLCRRCHMKKDGRLEKFGKYLRTKGQRKK